MKTILNKIYFHPLFLISTLIFILIGYFKFLTYFMLLIIVHELGHILVACLFKWNIDKIILLPFGALTKFNETINRPLIEDFLIAISGIIFQLLFFLFIKNNINYKYFEHINYFIIVFNILPIYPLDGSKILNVFFNIITSYKNSIIIICTISYIFILISFIISLKINKIISSVILFLFIDVNKLYNKRKELFNKFLLERYLKDYNFKKNKIIDNVYKMKRDYKHIFYINKKYITEKTFLKKMFDIKGNL